MEACVVGRDRGQLYFGDEPLHRPVLILGQFLVRIRRSTGGGCRCSKALSFSFYATEQSGKALAQLGKN